MNEDVRTIYQKAIDSKKKLSPEEKYPSWVFTCKCKSCKRLRRILGIGKEEEEEKEVNQETQ